MNKISMDYNCIKFFVGPPSSSDKCAIYADAVRRAYSDMSKRTLQFNEKYKKDDKYKKKVSDEIKKDITNYLIKGEREIFEVKCQEDFDQLHEGLCKEIYKLFTKERDGKNPFEKKPAGANDETRETTISDGQAQKILNMTIKYIYMLYNYFYAADELYGDEIEKLNNIIPFLHAPIDSLVIDAATNEKSAYYLGCNKPDHCWSKLYYEEYMKLQLDIREKTSVKGTNAFMWELENYPFK